MTIRQSGFLIWEYYRYRLNAYERGLLKKLLDGISGLGELSDHDLKDYLSAKQIEFLKELGKRFHLLGKSKKSE